MMEIETYALISFSIGNDDGELVDLHKAINFPVEPTVHSNLELIYEPYGDMWRYILFNNFEGYKELCRGTLIDEQFKLVYDKFQLHGNIETTDERELNVIVDALTDVIQDDYTMRIKAESAVHELVQRGEIRAITGDKVIAAMGSREEY